jgi:ligand-binding sensor domain-containing protein/two-component sensor histidine kinase
VFISSWATAQPFPPFFHHLTQSNGLSEQTNAYFSQDSKGYIWIGSFDGLNRFDGKTIKIYRATLPDGSFSPNITSKVYEDQKGNRWFSSSGGLHFIAKESDSIHTVILKPQIENSSENEHVLIHIDNNSILWVVAGNGLHMYDPNSNWDTILHPIQTYSCYTLTGSKGNVTGLVNLLIDQGGGIELFEYTPSGIHKSIWLTGNDGTRIPKSLALFARVEGDSLIWLPTDNGLVRFPVHDPRRAQIFSPPGLKNRTGFWDVAVWDGTYLAITSSRYGIFFFDKRPGHEGFNMKPYPVWPEKEPNPQKCIQNVFVSRDGTLWLSTWKKGVYYGNPGQHKFVRLPAVTDTSQTKSVASVVRDPSGDIWFALHAGGINKTDLNGLVTPYLSTFKKALPSKFFLDQQGNLWAFNASTVYLKKRNATRFLEVAHHLNRLYNMLQLSENDFLFICPGGLYPYQKGSTQHDFAAVRPIIIHNNIFDAFQDSQGRIFISDEVDGISIYNYSNKSMTLQKELTGVGYSNGMVEQNNIRWFATNKGLLRLDINDFSIKFVKGPRRILECAFNAVLPDDAGNLWLSSNNGLYKYTPSSGAVKHYTESDGLQGMQFMPGSACRFSDGRLAFGGVNGLNVLYPDHVRDNPNPPIIHFTDWIVNDTGSVDANPEYLVRQSFSYENRTLSFRFTGIDYSAPDEVLYRYRLAGFEKDTVEGGANGFARYAQLPAGDYSFQVWAANSDGVWTEQPHELRFTIQPPWYATWWARSLQILFATGLLYTLYRNRIARVKREEAERRKEAEFRQKEAESKQLSAELQNAVLRLQMNPHFIFNSMNSISSYILQKDIDTANDYLGRFARLMRSILNLASQPLIPIADEIDLLEQYLSAESMRLEQKFTWQFNVENALDIDEIMLPTMILQPFVENAIWHGLSPKKTEGHIRVGFQKHEQTLICTVEDNGVGRNAENIIRPESHPSKAIEITEQRLRMIDGQTSLQLIDLHDAMGAACGTRVEIKLPLNL